MTDGSQTRSSHESISFTVGDETIRDRTGQPVVHCHESSHEQTVLNGVGVDFRIPGLPHSVVKHAESSRVRELVKKIENHPDRHALQQDGHGDAVPKAGLEQAAADSRGSRTFVCANT